MREMTQGDLAGSDYSVGFISRIESGARQPSRHALATIAGRLGVTAEFLLTGAEEVDALARRHDVDRAELALAGGDIDEAVAITAELLENTDLSPWPDLARRVRLVHALCYEAMGDLHSAIIALEDLAAEYDSDEESAKVGIALSRCYRESGDYALAIRSGERILRTMEHRGLAGTTEHVRLSMTVSGAYFESGELGVATRMARRAIKAAEANSSPEAQAAAYWNASVYERTAGRVQVAVDLASRALSILENGNSTRNLAKLRTQLAHTLLNDPSADTDEIRSHLDLASRELDWSACTPLDRARNVLVTARLLLREGDPARAIELLDSVPADVCHQDPSLTAEVSVNRVMALTVMSEPVDREISQTADLLTLLGADHGVAQLWFSLGEAAQVAGRPASALEAFRQASICLGASRMLMPSVDRPAFRLPAIP
jgi:tetratricopeptide (TPR) repeat protein